MSATARVTILMEPAQKAALSRKAKAVGQSVGEYVRHRALDEDAVLTALVSDLKASTAQALTTVDEALARMDARDAARAERDAEIRRQALEELAHVDLEAVARLFDAEGRQSASQPSQREAAPGVSK